MKDVLELFDVEQHAPTTVQGIAFCASDARAAHDADEIIQALDEKQPDRAELSATDQYQFQWWALGLVGARPVEQKKGADRGIDGRLYFRDGLPGDKTRQIIFSVKAGRLKPDDVRALGGVIDREKAAIGVLISFEEPTKKMRSDAASAGFVETAWGKHSKLQILTVAELLKGKGVDYPRTSGINTTFKKAPKVVRERAKQLGVFDSIERPDPTPDWLKEDDEVPVLKEDDE